MTQDRNSIKKQEDMTKSGVALKGTMKNDSKVSTKGEEKKKQKEKEEKEEKPQSTLQCFDEPFFEEALQTLIGLGFPEE